MYDGKMNQEAGSITGARAVGHVNSAVAGIQPAKPPSNVRLGSIVDRVSEVAYALDNLIADIRGVPSEQTEPIQEIAMDATAESLESLLCNLPDIVSRDCEAIQMRINELRSMLL